ncbi:MAG: efflux RND transporter periplasmic adaptor subunit [Gammaproteobacteria bacterium]|nr:efflux RND transporter periplasmic adaptor subunit [Gammaproteobacteria bacterium]
MKRFALIGGIILVAVALSFVMVQMKPAPPKKERVELDPLVEVLELETMTANFEVRSQGTVRPRTETTLSAEISGTITQISPKFIAGGVFGGNEVLMRIDPTNYAVAVDQADALVKQRQIEYDGASKLRSQGYRAEAELASAAAALATARAELVRAERNLERTFIRLPYDGIVRNKEADIGQFVNPGTRLGVVFATDFAEVRLPLTDLDLAFVDLPDATEISASGSADGPLVTLSAVQQGELRSWSAQIVRTEGVVDESSRVTYAVARVDDPYARESEHEPLPVGTFVTARIAGAIAENIIRVPRSIVRGSDELVFVDDDDKIRIRKIMIARSDADFVYIRSGAEVGERVVMTALETPVNGMPVRTDSETDSASDVVATVGESD